MNNLTISIFGNQIFFKIINELKLFFKFNIKFYENLDLCLKDALRYKQFVILFVTEKNRDDYKKIEKNNFPIIVISKFPSKKNLMPENLVEQLNIPFAIFELEKKIYSLLVKNEFKRNSLIRLADYTIDKNERKIKKNELELQLSEKEINFLILFSRSKKPVSRSLVLRNVWNYSSESETHTVETHIHRLRKKILKKFGDDNFIKNNNKGYYI